MLDIVSQGIELEKNITMSFPSHRMIVITYVSFSLTLQAWRHGNPDYFKSESVSKIL
jgi:hypothetical protein